MVDLKVGVSSVSGNNSQLRKTFAWSWDGSSRKKSLGHFELDTLSCYLFIEGYRQCFQIRRMTRILEVLLSGYHHRHQPSLLNSAVLGLPERCRRWACAVGWEWPKNQEPPRVTQLTGSLATNWIAAFERRLQTRFRSVTWPISRWLDSGTTCWPFWISSAERLSVGILVIPSKPARLSGLCSERCSHLAQQLACWFTAIVKCSRVTKSSNGYYVGMPLCWVWVARKTAGTMRWRHPFSAISKPQWPKAVRFGMSGSYEEWCLNTLGFAMPGSVSIRAMAGRHHNSMKMNLRRVSTKPLSHLSIFLDRASWKCWLRYWDVLERS